MTSILSYSILVLSLLVLSSCGGSNHSQTMPQINSVSSAKHSSAVQSSSANSSSAMNIEFSPLLEDAFYGYNTRQIGRFDNRIPKRLSFTWSGSALEYSFKGTSTSIGIEDNGQNRFHIEIDDLRFNLFTKAGNFKYKLISNLPNANHTVRITRVSESLWGPSAFTSDPETDGDILSVPTAPSRKLLALGDSLTTGFGIEGASHDCPFEIATSNQQLTYAALAAKTLNADLHSIAWSGIGVYRAYNEVTPVGPTLVDRQQRILADDTSAGWDTTLYIPDAIVINIGTNDYAQGDPNPGYKNALGKLLAQLQTDYSNALIYLVVSPALQGNARSSQMTTLKSFATSKINVIEWTANFTKDGYGCGHHPNITTNTQFGKILAQTLASDLGW
jgi:lysophospholipase L1-like esterase